MSKIKSKTVRSTISNPDVLSMFQGVLGGESGAPPLVAIWPKFEKLRDGTARFVRVVELLAGARCLRARAEQPAVARFAAGLRTQHTDVFGPAIPNLAQYLAGDTTAALDPRAAFSAVPADTGVEFAKLFPAARDSQLVKLVLVTCANLVPHKRALADASSLRARFLERDAGTRFAPVHACADLDFRRLWADTAPGPFADAAATAAANSDHELLLLALHQLYSSSHDVYTAFSMPDVDVEEFSSVVMSSIGEVRGKIPRCNEAFDKIIDSVGLLRGNFSSYYRDFVGSNNPTIIMENFVLDVSRNADSSPAVARQFRTIISHYKKIASQSSTDPKLQTLFRMVDKNFAELERTRGGGDVASDDVDADDGLAGGKNMAGSSAEDVAAAVAAAEAAEAAAEAAEAAEVSPAAKSEAARARARRKKARHASNVAARATVGGADCAAAAADTADGGADGAADGAADDADDGAFGDALNSLAESVAAKMQLKLAGGPPAAPASAAEEQAAAETAEAAAAVKLAQEASGSDSDSDPSE
jgi:hypothetical protein